MKTTIKQMAMGLVVVAAGMGQAWANDELALANKSGCMSCHAVDQKVLGPAFKDVAKRYADDKEAVPKLVAKVKAGGSGVWGRAPMTPHPEMADKDVQALVKWVLAMK